MKLTNPSLAELSNHAARRRRVWLRCITAMLWMGLTARSALAQVPSLEWAEQVNQANKSLRSGDVSGALAAYERASELNASSDELNFNRAVALYRQGDLEAARNLFDSVAKSSNDALAALARYNSGNSKFAAAVKLKDQDPTAAIRQLEAAVQDYRSSLAITPDNDARANIELATKLIERLRQAQTQPQQTPPQQDADQQQPQNPQDDSSSTSESPPAQAKDPQSEPEKRQNEQDSQQNGAQRQQDQDSQTDQDTPGSISQDQEAPGQQSQEQQSQEQQSQEQQSQEQQPKGQQDGGKQAGQQAGQQGEQEGEPQSHRSETGTEEGQPPQDTTEGQAQTGEGASDDDSTSSPPPGNPDKQAPGSVRQPSSRNRPRDDSSAEPPDRTADDNDAAPPTNQEGELQAADKVNEPPADSRQQATPDEATNRGQMTQDEAVKLLQAIRDRDMLRRLRRQAAERARHIPVDKDW